MNKKKIVDQFIYNHPADLKEFPDQMTIEQSRKAYRSLIDEYVEKLCYMKVGENSDWMIYFVYRYLKDDSFAEPYFYLDIFINECKSRKVRTIV